MATIQERYNPIPIAANTTNPINSQSIGGFLAVTAGTISIVNAAAQTILAALPVSAGVYYPLPIYVGHPGATFATAGGASGTLLV